VLFGDTFADACELLKRKSTHIYMWRFKDAPPELACKASTVVPLLVNESETFTTLQQSTTLILEWLIALGTDSGKIHICLSYITRTELFRNKKERKMCSPYFSVLFTKGPNVMY
jgi:hypothetical protein